MADHPLGLPLTEIARRLEVPKSAAHRLLAALVKRGFSAQDAATERYRLTVQMVALGFRFLANMGLVELCQPALDRLAARTGELVRMALVDGEGLVWVAKAQGALTGLRYDPDMGHPVVLHATATGKAWLATLDEAMAVRLVRERGFVVPARFGKPVVRDELTLLQELRRTRERGYGLAIEEGETGTAAIACAIHERSMPGAPAVGTVSVAGPIVRLSPSRLSEIADDVRATASELTALWPLRRLGPANATLSANRAGA